MIIKFSIIVPAYNVEQYLSECIESVLNQTYDDFELILVNDGSNDSTPGICDYYLQQDSRIKIIHKKNEGLSEARNSGLKIATGDYLTFLDGDDKYTATALSDAKEIIQKQNKPEVVIGRFETFSTDGTGHIYDPELDQNLINNLNTPETMLKYILSKNGFIMTACRYFINRKFILKNDLFFYHKGYHEDEHWSPGLFCSASSYGLYQKPFYLYRIRQNSIQTIKNIISQLDKIRICDELNEKKLSYSQNSTERRFYQFQIDKLLAQAIGECPRYSLKEINKIAISASKTLDKNPQLLYNNKLLGKCCTAFGKRFGIIAFAIAVKLKRLYKGERMNWCLS